MGIFLQAALLPGQTPDSIPDYIAEIAGQYPDMALRPESCFSHAYGRGAGIFFNEDAAGFDRLADALSQRTGSAVLLLYIYDDDFWGYFFWENGRELDRFSPVPDYFDEEPETDFYGNPELIAEYFGVKTESIKNYYRRWQETEADELAYLQDKSCYGDCWQMTDFMEALGYPWDELEAEAPPLPVPSPPKETARPFTRVSMRPAVPPGPAFLAPSTLEKLPDAFEVSYIWELLKRYPEELFLLFDFEKYDEAAEILGQMLQKQPENAELYLLRAYCCLSHPCPPRTESEAERLRREEQARLDLDRAFECAPDNVRLLRMHCQPFWRLRHWSNQPEIPCEKQLAFLDRLAELDARYAPAYRLAQGYCYERMGDTARARMLLSEMIHTELPATVDFNLAFEELFRRLEPDKDLKTELERDYKNYIRAFIADNPKKKFRQAQLCWKRKRAATAGMVCYEREDLQLLAPSSAERAPS